MTNLLDHIPRTSLLDGVDDWPKSVTRTEWFRLTRDLIQSIIADMDLDPDSLSQGEEALISASCSKTSCASALYLNIAMGMGFEK